MFLEAENIRKLHLHGIRTKSLLNGVSLQLKYGEMVCLMGPSGSGKSALFQILSGLTSMDSGTLTYVKDGIPKPLNQLSFGVVFKDNNLFADFKIKGNFRMQGIMARMPKSLYKERFELMVKRYNLAGVLDDYPQTLSAETLKWVALAKMDLISPDFFFVEEPTLYMSPNEKFKLLHMLKSISRSSGMLVLTNDVICASYSDRVLFMNEGNLKSELLLDQHSLLIEREAQVYSWLKGKGW